MWKIKKFNIFLTALVRSALNVFYIMTSESAYKDSYWYTTKSHPIQ